MEIKGFLPDDDALPSPKSSLQPATENTIKGFIGDDDTVARLEPLTAPVQGVGLMANQDLQDFTYQDFKSNEGLRKAAVRFGINHLNFSPEELEEEEAIDEVLEHFRSLDTNELTAIQDY